MATWYSQLASGNWSNATTMWNEAANGSGTWGIPADGDAHPVVIQAGHTVTFDVDQSAWTTGVPGITITSHATTPGILTFATNASTYLKLATATTIAGTNAASKGQLNCATAETPLSESYTAIIELLGTATINATYLSISLYGTNPTYVTALVTTGEKACTGTAADDKINCTAHPFIVGQPLYFWANTGTLPGGVSEGTVYYVQSIDTNWFKISATSGGDIKDLTSNSVGAITVEGGAAAGTAVLPVTTDLTADTPWKLSAAVTVANWRRATNDAERLALHASTAITATTVTLSSNLVGYKAPRSILTLNRRNVEIRFNGTQNAVDAATSAVLQCSIRQTGSSLQGNGIFNSTSCTLSGSISGGTYGVRTCTRCTVSGTVSGNGTTSGGGLYTCVGCLVTGSVNGNANALYGCYSCEVTETGNLSGNGNGLNSCISCSLNGACNGGNYAYFGCTSCAINGIISNCIYGLRAGSYNLSRATFTSNIYDLYSVDVLEGYGANLGSATQCASYQQSVAGGASAWQQTMIYDIANSAGVPQIGQVKGWMPGGKVASHTPGSQPSGFTCPYAHQHTLEVVTYPVFLDLPIFVKKNFPLTVDVYILSSAAGFTEPARIQLIDPDYAFNSANSKLVDYAAGVNWDDDTAWHKVTVTYTPSTADKMLILRVRARNASGTVDWYPDFQSGLGEGEVLNAIRAKTDNLPSAFPTNFADLAITSGTGKVTVGTNADKTGYTVSTVSDKTGYSLSQSFPSNFSSLSIDANGRVDVSKWGGTAITSAYVQANAAQLGGQTATAAAAITVGAYVGNATAALAVDASGRVDLGKVLGTASAGQAGYVGVDWGHVYAPTTAVGLSGTTISTSQHVIVDSGTVTTLTNLPVVTTDWLTAAGVKADAVTKIQAGLSTLDGTGVQSAMTAQGYTTTRAGYLDVLNGIIAAIWNAATSGMTAVGSIGKKLADWTIGTAQTGDAYAIVNNGTYGNAALQTAVSAIPTNPLTTLGTNAPSGWINAAAIASAALNGKGDWSTYAGGDTSGTTTLLSRVPQTLEFSTDSGHYYVKADSSHYAVAKSPATLDWAADVTNKPTIGTGTSTLTTTDIDNRLAAWGKTGFSLSGTVTTFDALVTALNSAHGSGSWATATGFSTLTTSDIDARLTAWGKTGFSLSGTTTTFDALVTALNSAHGSGSWATATGFSTLTTTDIDNRLAAWGKTGFSLTQTFPANFASLAIDSSGRMDLGKILGTDSAGAAGSVGIDWAHVYNQDTGVTLSATSISSISGVTFPSYFSSMQIDSNGYVKVSQGAGQGQINLTSGQVRADVVCWKGGTPPDMTGDAYALLGTPTWETIAADIDSLYSYLSTQTQSILLDIDNCVEVIDWDDIYSIITLLGTPAGASVSADIAAVKADTGDKTGYSLDGAYDPAKTAAQAGDVMDLVDAPNATAVTAIQSGLATDAHVLAIPTNPLTTLGTNAPSGWINAAAIDTDALNGKGDWATVGAKMDLADSLNTTGVADLKTQLGTMPASGDWLTSLGTHAPAGWIDASAIDAAALNAKGDWLTPGGYTAPDNASINDILADSSELQTKLANMIEARGADWRFKPQAVEGVFLADMADVQGTAGRNTLCCLVLAAFHFRVVDGLWTVYATDDTTVFTTWATITDTHITPVVGSHTPT